MYCFFVDNFYIFFFKQKAAYEMGISDWSSDVCSSDLGRATGCRLFTTSSTRRHPSRRHRHARAPLPLASPLATNFGCDPDLCPGHGAMPPKAGRGQPVTDTEVEVGSRLFFSSP